MQLICSKDVIVYTRSSARRKVWMKPLSDSAIRYNYCCCFIHNHNIPPAFNRYCGTLFLFSEQRLPLQINVYRATTIVVNIRQIGYYNLPILLSALNRRQHHGFKLTFLCLLFTSSQTNNSDIMGVGFSIRYPPLTLFRINWSCHTSFGLVLIAAGR